MGLHFRQPPRPVAENLRERWMLEPGVAFLNHGSFGAIPRATFAHQQRWAARVEAEPVEILIRQYHGLMERTKTAIGRWLGMRNEDFGLVANATEGVAAVLSSMTFSPGDELVATNHVYNAVRQAMRYTANRWGATYREIELPTPIEEFAFIEATIGRGLTDRTRLLVVDHATSPTGMVFPLGFLADWCAGHRIDLLVDGAHAPGMLELDVPKIGAAYYAGNLHKWACCPRSVGFLWTRPDLQSRTHPAVMSHHFEKGFAAEFEWLGTRDPSAWLAVPSALRYVARLGWERVRGHNWHMATWASHMLSGRWGVERLIVQESMHGSMATIPLPGKLASLTEEQARSLQSHLYRKYRIEAPVVLWQDRWHVRISCQVYNTPDDYERLARAVEYLKQW